MLLLLLGLASIGCTAQPTVPGQPTVPAEPTEPTVPGQPTLPAEPTQHGEPLPGSFHLTSDPQLAPYRLTIRIDDVGGASRRSAEFEEGDPVVVDWSTLPLPQLQWIDVNGQDCEGTFGIQARIETDLLLILTDDACRVEILGTHPEGGPHDQPGG